MRCRCTAGGPAEAAGFARRTIAAFEAAGVDVVVVNSAGCGSAMKEYAELLGRATAGGAAPDPGAADWPGGPERFAGQRA